MPKYDLVFEGGGAKGSAFVGALEAFTEAGHIHGRLVGTSAGAITATLLAAGFTPKGMQDAVKEGITTFMDRPTVEDIEGLVDTCEIAAIVKELKVDLPLIDEEKLLSRMLRAVLKRNEHLRQAFTFVEAGGLYSGSAFTAWLDLTLAKQNIPVGTTFSDFHKLKNAHLSLVATDVSDAEMLVLNHRTAPEVPVAKAVRMSMSIPFIWKEVIWQEAWGKYLGRDKAGNAIVDGGVLSNFPIDLVATKSARATDFMGADTDPDTIGTLGLLIDEEEEVPGVEADEESRRSLATVARIHRLLSTMRKAHDNVLIQTFKSQICRLPAKGYGTTEFKMDDAKLKALVDAGKNAMNTFLRRI